MTIEPITRASIDTAILCCVEVAAMEKEGVVPHFNALADRLAKDRSRATISRAHDIMEVEGFATAEWRQRDDGRHVRAFVLTDLGRKAAEAGAQWLARGYRPVGNPGDN